MVTAEGGAGISPVDAEDAHFPWPTVEGPASGALVLWGHGVKPGAGVPPEAAADDIAPTLAELMDVERPHPEVRSGDPLPLVQDVAPPSLVVEIVWKGADPGTAEWTELLERGAGTLRLSLGSEPADPAAVLTTLGTGGIPAQHGVTGSLLRDDSGAVIRPWSKALPLSVIAGLGDDLDEATAQEALVGSILDSPTERGLVGGTWYVKGDEDDLIVSGSLGEDVAAVQRLLARGYGRDDVPDLIGMVQAGPPADLFIALAAIEAAVTEAVGPRVTFVLIGLPAAQESTSDSLPRRVEEAVNELAPSGRDLIEAVVPGGVYLDQNELAAERIEDDKVIDRLRALTAPDGEPLFADVFPQIAISLGTYC